jgi:hypothetical protein
MKRAVGYGLVFVGSVVASFFTIGSRLAFHEALSDDTGTVAFSELLAEMDSGMIEDIEVDGRVYTFRVKGGRKKVAIGPPGERDPAASLRPLDPKTPAPKIVARR